jgi:energy-coupling factor transporter ATP-binding protein EcfA2
MELRKTLLVTPMELGRTMLLIKSRKAISKQQRKLRRTVMPLRVDQIQLAPNGPIGPVSVDSLANFDLIVVTGTNGAGKSTLIEPLGRPGPTTGRASCINEAGERSDYIAQGVNQKITFITSIELMSKFVGFQQALALAAGTTRLLHEGRLLAQLQRSLNAPVGSNVNAEPPLLNNHRVAYLQADRLCANQVRTEAEYNRIGEGLALRTAASWQRLDLNAQEAVRLNAENALRPQARSIAGLYELSQLLTELIGLPIPVAAIESNASRLHRATDELRVAINHAATLISNEPALDVNLEINLFADDVLGRCLEASQRISLWLNARDILRECRRSALVYLGNQNALGCFTENCVVCNGQVNSVELSASLQAQVAGEDTEGQRLRGALNDIDLARVSLNTKLGAFEAADVLALQEHGRIVAAISNVLPTLHGAINWHPAVVGSADELRVKSELWIQEHGGSPSIDAVEAARTLSALAKQKSDELVVTEQSLNTNLAADQQEFRTLQALGVALSMRHALDAIPWEVRLDQIDTARRRAAQRDRWIAVLETMSTELENRAREAANLVVDDSGVQIRFRRLIERLPNHRRLNDLQFRGDTVELGQQNASNTLSEGQNVLVNIAAAIAVVGKVAGTPEHRPGWIVFDEPTNGLDSKGCSQVAQYLGALAIADIPCQVVVATLDTEFAEQLMSRAVSQGNRRVKHVSLPEFQPGNAVTPVIRERIPNPVV